MKGRCGYDAADPFKPTLHANKLNEPLGQRGSKKIFTCSMGDLFDAEVPETWREAIYQIMDKSPQHIFQVLTKQVPQPRSSGPYPKNLWLGISIDGTSAYWEEPLSVLQKSQASIKFVSFEPLLGNCLPAEIAGLDWIILGAETGPSARPVDKELAKRIVNDATRFKKPLFVKNNLAKQFSIDTDPWIALHQFPARSEIDAYRLEMRVRHAFAFDIWHWGPLDGMVWSDEDIASRIADETDRSAAYDKDHWAIVQAIRIAFGQFTTAHELMRKSSKP